jgi:hypothetical protein
LQPFGYKSNTRLSATPRVRSLELPDSEIAAQIDSSQISSNRHTSTSTVQRRLCESGLHGWIAAKKERRKKERNPY